VYALDMGRPVAIRELAEQMIRLSGKRPGIDIAVSYTGLRPGEKLHEILFHPEERYQRTRHPRILEASPREVRATTLRDLQRRLDALLRQPHQDAALMALLCEAVPEYTPEPDSVPPEMLESQQSPALPDNVTHLKSS
jgi:FlaA1/EpsC-like NDP-sugar epimerase